MSFLKITVCNTAYCSICNGFCHTGWEGAQWPMKLRQNTRKEPWEQRILPLHSASDTGTLTIENWNICAKELKNPLFHKTWAPQQFHCQACLKSFLAVQVSNQFQIYQGDMARCHVQWRSGTRPTQEQVCYCIPRKSTIPMSAQSQPWFFWYVMQEDISWQTTSCTLPASDLARQLS